MSEFIARRCYVSGRVQGVFYRASTRQKAAELGCNGYARNLADSRVEVLIVGKPASVQLLIDWLWHGPPGAQVTNVEIHPAEIDSPPQRFTTG
jgi:acylphosphatase